MRPVTLVGYRYSDWADLCDQVTAYLPSAAGWPINEVVSKIFAEVSHTATDKELAS